MLISPAFLPPRLELSEDDWLDTAMPSGEPGNGFFPVSYVSDPQGATHTLDWHGGLHLTAPLDRGPQPLAVRAIADGTIVYVRQRTSADSPDDPLNYGPGYTSDAVVIIRHETDIGADGAGTPTKVVFYSVYMHLHSIWPKVRVGNAIYRKDEIGQAGHVYGKPHVMHFEICCDDDNLALLVGRRTGPLKTTADGRTDAVFGEMYFHLSAGTQVFGQHPLPQSAQAMAQPQAPAPAPAPAPTRSHGHAHAPSAPPQPLASVHTTTDECVIGLRYAGGEGIAGQRGDAIVTTYKLDGTVIGDPLREADAEYDIYRSAMHISEAYPASGRPAPSAVYELLRFGRVLGPDALAPADVPHWREVNYPGGRGWVNLNAANVHKFSDADFPGWKGWKLIDDDVDGDARCDSALLRQAFYSNGSDCLTQDMPHALTQLRNPDAQRRLKRLICKFPSEWDASTIDKRWAWLMMRSDENPVPLTTEDYAEFKTHVSALCFDCPELFKAQWCFEPAEFISQFRRCGWLSSFELAQCLPRRRPSQLLWSEAKRRSDRAAPSVNIMLHKYIGSNRIRQAHVIAQTFLETDLLNTFSEYSKGSEYPYGAFYGRGLMQLTWASNYEKYGLFRQFGPQTDNYLDARISSTSTHLWEDKGRTKSWGTRYDPSVIETSYYNAGDSGGFYWVSKHFKGTSNISKIADLGHETFAVGLVSWAVNGGSNGYVERQQFFAFVFNILSDTPSLTGVVQLTYARFSQALMAAHPTTTQLPIASAQVNYEKQTP